MVVPILRGDVLLQCGQVGWSYREDAVAALPGEVREFRGLGFEPHGRGRFELFDEFRNRDGAGESDGKMDVVFNAAGEEAVAVEVACDGGEVGVELWTEGGFEERCAVLGGKDDVDEDE